MTETTANLTTVCTGCTHVRNWHVGVTPACTVRGCTCARFGDPAELTDAETLALDLYRAPTRAFDPAADAPLTVRQHPEDGRTDPDARRAIRLPSGPWLAISGPDAGRVLAEQDVHGWPIPHPAWWSPSLRADLDHLHALARSESTR